MKTTAGRRLNSGLHFYIYFTGFILPHKSRYVKPLHLKGVIFMSSINTKDGRARNFTFLVYDDDVINRGFPDWKFMLHDLHVPAFYIYHCHDLIPVKDVLTGEIIYQDKKPHYHVMVMFDGKKSNDQLNLMFPFACNAQFQVVQSISGMARYLCHLDDPDKYQYPLDAVVGLSGADYMTYIELPCDRYKTLQDMHRFIIANDVSSFPQFASYCLRNRLDWYKALADNCTYFIKELLWQVRKEGTVKLHELLPDELLSVKDQRANDINNPDQSNMLEVADILSKDSVWDKL